MIALSESQIYRFEDVEVDLARGCLRRENVEKHLRQKTFQVLVYLLERRERLVSKEELMETVWKDTAVTDDALVQSIKEIRRALGDSSNNPKFIKTVPKAGYRFISSVEEVFGGAPTFIETEEITRVEVEYEETSYSPQFAAPISTLLPVSNPKEKFTRRVGLALIMLAVVGLAFYFVPKFRQSDASSAAVILPQTPGKRTIAVMYFDNQSGSQELEWLREGLADMLITNLSRSGKLTVLSRGQLHQLLERNGESRGKIELDKTLEIARKAQAAHVVTGSFARLGDKMRLDVQLYDVSGGSLVAAESLTVERAEQILTEIDLLALKLANRLGISPYEAATGALLAEAMTDNLEAYRYYSLGVEKTQALHSKEAIELLEKAVALDPNFAMAHARIGYAYAVSWGLAEKGKPYLERAFGLSARLTEKDRLHIAAWYAIANLDYAEAIGRFREIVHKYPTETEAYVRLGSLLTGEGQTEEAVSIFKQGLSIDPEAKNIYNVLGKTYSSLNQHAEAVAMGERYVALEPQEANAFDSLGLFYQQAGNYLSAAENYNRALELKPEFEIAVIHLGNIYFQTGRYDSAIEAYKKYLQIAPSENERARGYSCLAQVYLAKNNLALSEKAAAQAFQNNKEFVWDSLVIALRRGDKTKAAKYEQLMATELNSTTNRGMRHNRRFEFYRRGYIAFENKRGEEAIENFKAVLRHLPVNWNIADFEDSLANAYLRLERYDEAVAEYERILRINPNYPLVRFHLAEIYEQKNQPDEARAAYRQFLQTWKDADADIPEILHAKKFLGDS